MQCDQLSCTSTDKPAKICYCYHGRLRICFTCCRPPRSICRQCAEYTGPYPAHGDGGKGTLGAAAAAVGNAVAKVVGMVTGMLDVLCTVIFL